MQVIWGQVSHVIFLTASLWGKIQNTEIDNFTTGII